MKNKHRIAIAIAIGSLVIVPFFWWLGGYNFDVRGFQAVSCAFWTLTIAIGGFALAMTYPD